MGYVLGELLWVDYAGVWYESSVIGVDDEGSRVRVHYKGWGRKYDQWVQIDRVMKDTEENRRIVEERTREVNEAKKKKKKKKRNSRGSVKRKRKRVDDDSDSEEDEESEVEDEDDDDQDLDGNTTSSGGARDQEKDVGKEVDDLIARQSFQVNPSSALKLKMLEDVESVCFLKKVYSLPMKPCVRDIFKEFKESNKDSNFDQIIEGLTVYFDRICAKSLLYSQEIPQHDRYCDKYDPFPSEVYGAQHLLRLLVKLPVLMANASIEKENALKLENVSNLLLQFIEDLDSKKTIELPIPKPKPKQKQKRSRSSSLSESLQTTPSSFSKPKRNRVPPLDFWCNERIIDGEIIRPNSIDTPLWSPASDRRKSQ